MRLDNNQQALLALVRAGLWEQEVRLPYFDLLDLGKVYQLAEKQSVVGLVAAGLEHVRDVKVPKEVILQYVVTALKLEDRNLAMNRFISNTVKSMRNKGIYTLLVKGQGLAQCYNRPLWRPCGDVDFFFSRDEYPKAVIFISNHNNAKVVQNARYTRSFGVVIDNWIVELHGTLRNCLSSKMDRIIDEVQDDLFYGGNVRSWMNGETQVFLPGVDNDVFLVFTHFVRHLYKEGVCLRQVCDLCRLLWSFNDKVNHNLLKSRIKRAGLLAEWRSFAALAVDFLGMPMKDVPLYDNGKKWHKKGNEIMNFIIEGRKGNTIKDALMLARLFPFNTLLFSPGLFFHINGKKIKEMLFK